jgi:hypothetical protein
MEINTKVLPVVVVDVDDYRGAVDLKIGDYFASIIEPKLPFLDKGLVYIGSNSQSKI